MAAELQTSENPSSGPPMKRKRKGKNPSKRPKPFDKASAKSKKPTMKMKKLYKKRAKDYDSEGQSSDDAEFRPDVGSRVSNASAFDRNDESSDDSIDGDKKRDLNVRDEDGGSDDEFEEGEAQHGITRFAEGCRVFKLAFTKIMAKKLTKDPLGPILSANRKLIAEKLSEDKPKSKSEVVAAKKEKHLLREKGHIEPAKNYLDAKEKFLISVATKGVVKLFNAVNKTQNTQKGLNPSKSKDAKVWAKRRKQTFLSEIKKSATGDNRPSSNSSKVPESTSVEDDDQPGWAPLQDTYMLTNSKMKDWDKMQDSMVDDHVHVPLGSSSDEE